MDNRWVEWVDPFYDGAEPCYHYARATDIVACRRRQEPRYTAEGKTDQEVLDDFMIVHWAQFVEPVTSLTTGLNLYRRGGADDV